MLENFIYAKQKSLFEEALNNGEVLDEAIVFIEDTKEIWNHGTYFNGSTVDLSNIEASIENIINNKADKTEIPTKISQLEDDKGILIGEETSDTLDDVETNTYIKYVAQTLTEEQQKQAKKNIGIGEINSMNYDLNVKAINHRGYSSESPENTIPAYIMSK